MEGLRFETALPAIRSDPARADIACFVGFAACRRGAAAQRVRLERILRDLGWAHDDRERHLPAAARVLPPDVLPHGTSRRSFPAWLNDLGWRASVNAVSPSDLFRRAAGRLLSEPLAEWWAENDWISPFSERSAADLLELADVPIPIDTWDAFDALIAWNERFSADGTRRFDTTLGAAVRRFFLEGGRKCYVIRVDDPWPPSAGLQVRSPLRARILRTVVEPTPVDRSTWRGVGHLFGLPDVSFLCTPDLPELFADDPPPPVVEIVPPLMEERFVECAPPAVEPLSGRINAVPAPRCGIRGFQEWAAFVKRIGGLLAQRRREVQFVAAVPLPLQSRAGTPQWDAVATIQTAFVQLAYPWLRTRDSQHLPGAVEPPDGALTGMLAASALTSGAWRSVARQPVFGLTGLEPVLAPSVLERPLKYHGEVGERRTERRLRDRVSVFAPTPTGFQLLSDVTTDDDEAYRPANVNRLVASLVRVARVTGESVVFANNGEAVWRAVREALEEVLLRLWGEGALAGATSADAYDVRCDRSTMTQADLDAGRVIVRIQFTAASPIEQITVVLAMDEGGQVTLVPEPAADIEQPA